MSAIVRELVTRLSFSFDRTNLVKFERAISDFRTKFNIAKLEIGGLVNSIFDFATSAADAALATKDIADYAGIALNEFVALQTAAQKLTLRPDQFNRGILKLSQDLREAEIGAGRLFDIARQSGDKINFRDVNGKLVTTENLLFQIFEYLNSIQDPKRRQFVAGNIFDVESAGAWLRVVEQGPIAFKELVSAQKEYANNFKESIPAVIEYQKNLASLSAEWGKLAFTLAKVVVPVLAEVLGGLNQILEDTQQAGFGQTLSNIGASFANAFDFSKLFHDADTLEKMREQVQRNQDADFWKQADRERQQQFFNSVDAEAQRIQGGFSNSMNNTFEFNVPPGTTEQQATVMTEQLKGVLNNFKDEMARDIINNSPQVERWFSA